MYKGKLKSEQRQKGFTLIEIMVVVVILGILISFAALNILDEPDKARVVAAKNDIRTLGNALKLYHLDNGKYPTTEQGLIALSQKPTTGRTPRNYKPGGYLDKLPKDPWGGEYQYLSPGVRSEIDIFTYGADNQPGCDGWAADRCNWAIK